MKFVHLHLLLLLVPGLKHPALTTLLSDFSFGLLKEIVEAKTGWFCEASQQRGPYSETVSAGRRVQHEQMWLGVQMMQSMQ